MRPSLVLLAAGLFAGCGGGSVDDSIKIESITPAFSPLSGGTHIVIKGQGFLRDGAPPNHVVIGNTEAPLAAASDDTTLEVDTPPAEMPGDVPVVVFNRNGQATAMGMFHYSTGPTITGVSPNEVLFNAANTTVTVTGTGFMDENAGVTNVLIDGQPAVDVTVTSDTQLTFTALGGVPFVRPDLEVTNARGTAKLPGAYRYIPSTNPTVMVFPNRQPGRYVIYYDPTAGTTLNIPSLAGNSIGYRAVFQDANGDFWAEDLAQNFGKIDFKTQTLVDPIVLSARPIAFARMADTVYALDRNTSLFGKFDPSSGSFTPIGTGTITTPCCQQAGGGIGLATDGTNLFVATGNGISTINTTTGARGTVKALTPAVHLGKMRFIGTTIFAMTPAGVITINPTTGATASAINLGLTRSGALEVFTPGGTTP